jgi:hypothetical protein
MGRLIETTCPDAEVPVVVWTDLYWDEAENKLYLRSIRFGQLNHKSVRCCFRPDGNGPLIGDATSENDIEYIEKMQRAGELPLNILGHLSWGRWESVSDVYQLDLWQRLSTTHPNRKERAREFIKSLNLQLYKKLNSRVSSLDAWKERDEFKKAGMYDAIYKIDVDQEMFHEEPFFKRELERVLCKEAMDEIERWLNRLGYDEVTEIEGVMRDAQATKSVGAIRKAPKSTDHTLFIDFVKATSITRPTDEELEKETNISKSTWRRRFEDPVWVAELLRKVKRRRESKKYSRKEETRQMWSEVEMFVEGKLSAISNKIMKHSVSFDDNRRQTSDFEDLEETRRGEENR